MIAIKQKREWIWNFCFLPRVIAFNAHGESRALSLQAFTTQVRLLLLLLLLFFLLLSLLIYYDEISGCESLQAFTTQVYCNPIAMCQLSLGKQ